MDSAGAAPAVELVAVNKRFGSVQANRDITLSVPAATVHGIVGENGAGKSTLMSILYGFYPADSGEIRVAGKRVNLRGSEDAIAVGIGMVHQHFMLVENLTVLENVMLGAEGGALLARGSRRARTELERLERDYGLQVPPDAVIEDLNVGQRQRVEILKALYRGARVLILDEPTGVLTPQETDQLFSILRALRDEGVTILLITHKLGEIMDVTDDVSVMRAGELVASRRTRDTNEPELAELMVGRRVLLRVEKTSPDPGNIALDVRDLTVRDKDGVARLDSVSFSVREGEIVGVAGVSGNGQSELLEALAGIRVPDGGSFRVGGEEISAARPADGSLLRALRVAHVPEDRHRMGLVTAFSARECSVLGYQGEPEYNVLGLTNQAAVRSHCEHLMQAYDVRPADPDLRAALFSGGNQQKLVLARELERGPKVLLVGQPTRGVDIGAIEFIHRRLIAMRDEGCAVLLVSVELDEIRSLSDRILVMTEGRIAGEATPHTADERTLGLMMAGAWDGDAVGVPA